MLLVRFIYVLFVLMVSCRIDRVYACVLFGKCILVQQPLFFELRLMLLFLMIATYNEYGLGLEGARQRREHSLGGHTNLRGYYYRIHRDN